MGPFITFVGTALRSPAVLAIVATLTPANAGQPSSENGYFQERDIEARNKVEDDYEEKNPNQRIRYVTYTKTKLNEDGSTTIYSGRSSGPAVMTAQDIVDKRDAEHARGNEWLKGYGPAVVDEQAVGSLSDQRGKWSIRGREQQLIDRFGGAQSEGGSSGNRIRGVSKINPRGLMYHQNSNYKFGEIHEYTGFMKKTK